MNKNLIQVGIENGKEQGKVKKVFNEYKKIELIVIDILELSG